MPRNEAKRLSPSDIFQQQCNLSALESRLGQTVTLSYTKRNGQASSSTGTVEFFNGRPGFDTGSVTVRTADKGPRTINLHNITSIV